MSVCNASTAVATVWLTAIAVPVSAQTFDQQIAQCINQRQQFAESIAGCTALLQSGRLDSQGLSIAYSNRGVAFANQGDIDRAISDFNEAIRLSPQDAVSYYNRGNAYRDQDDPARAIADYSEAIRLNPQYANAYYNRGLAHERLGDLA